MRKRAKDLISEHGMSLRRNLKVLRNRSAFIIFGVMKTKVILTIAILFGALGLIAAGYCFWLMDNPLSYRWVPVVITGFLVAIFVFILSLTTSIIALIKLRRSVRAPNVPQTAPRI